MAFPEPRIAIIGTAGRDRTKPKTEALWEWMVAKALEIIPKGSHLVSGGAAWADHLACELYRLEHAESLHLYLPAPFVNGRFTGPKMSAGAAANYHHGNFSVVLDRFTLEDIELCIKHGAKFECEPEATGYGAFFNRNKKVAKAEGLLAFTWGVDGPTDGGTKNTWEEHERLHGDSGVRIHASLQQHRGTT